jgi:hypothetical protein
MNTAQAMAAMLTRRARYATLCRKLWDKTRLCIVLGLALCFIVWQGVKAYKVGEL